MNLIFEKLWNEYFVEECATVDNEEERALLKTAATLRKTVNELLAKEPNEAVERYVDALCALQSSFVKKAFFKGCEFSAAFLLETGAYQCGKKV